MTSSVYPVVKGTLVSTQNYTWNTADSLGKGASAVVYLGRHTGSGEYVAVKVYHERVYQGNKMDDVRELELLRQLNHENIIRLLAVEMMVSTMKEVIVMEYCEGGSLHHMLDQPQYYHGLPENEFLLVLQHVCSGMEYLQQMSVIHRDIKPGNIMRSLTKDGFSIYKLTDFGAARSLQEEENFQSLYGTEEYLHPGMYERAVLRLPNSQSFDAKVDLWSLGVTFYHIATGQLPFQPFGGRSNRRTMFEIITQKESGVISGIQSVENGPIQWKRDLPETTPLSNGLKSIVIPLLAGLMEPDVSKMITHQSLFRMVNNIKQKIIVNIFYYNTCEELVIFAEPNTALSGLQDLIASQTDIAASDQILIVGGRTLEEVVDQLCPVQSYPAHLLNDGICLFQREVTVVHSIFEPEIAPMPKSALADMDADVRLAHSCFAWGELMKRHQERACRHQERLVNQLLFLRLYVEGRLEGNKVNHDYVSHILTECKGYIDTFFDMVEILRDVKALNSPSHQDVAVLTKLLNNNMKRAHDTASQRLTETKRYIDMLVTKMEEIKMYASMFSATCSLNKCRKKTAHHLSMISGVYSRFRRDRSVKNEMTPHDVDIHRFEGHKLHNSSETIQAVVTNHCLPQLKTVYRNCIQVCESLTKSLDRVVKIEKNLAAVYKCMEMIISKLQGLKDSVLLSPSARGFSAHIDSLQVAQAAASYPGTASLQVAQAVASYPGTASLQVAQAVASYPGTASSETRWLLTKGENQGSETRLDGLTSMSDRMDQLREKLDFVSDILEQNSGMILQSLQDPSLQAPSAFTQEYWAFPEDYT